MKFWSACLDLLFPPKCAFCGRILERGEEKICRHCGEHLPAVEDTKAVVEGPYGRCAVAFYYEDMVKTGIHGLKFQGRQQSAPIFATYLSETVAIHLAGEFDAVTYVPISAKRLRKRGYDQSRLMAQCMANAWNTPLVTALVKTRDNPPQSGFKMPEERRANVLGAYRPARDGDLITGRRFLLVDDVVTTGSTLAACVDTLRRAGAASVVCAALATPREK